MARVLVAWSSAEGQTQKIGEEIARELAEAGHAVERAPIEEASAAGFDAVVLGASVHLGHHDEAAVRWAKAQLAGFAGVTAFFSVCLTAAHEDAESVATFEGYVQDFLAQSGWSPGLATTFAGALRYSKYGFFKKRLMRKVAEEGHLSTDMEHDVEYTSWASVAHFATDIARALG